MKFKVFRRLNETFVIPIAFALSCLLGQTARCEESQADFFESKIRPILVEHCYECHSNQGGEAGGNLRLDNAASARKGGDRGPAVVPSKADDSLLIRAISYVDPDMEMPPTGKLPDGQIELLRHWIVSGAFDPRQTSDEDSSKQAASPLERDPKSHWAYVTPQRAQSPKHLASDSQDFVDAAIAETAATKAIAPTSVADRATLIRRIYYDLTGLVPSIEEIAGFVNDKPPAAYERLVDRLLASPEFGEWFGRHWMDVARYADTVGYNFGGRERRLIGSERFRDWTIRAFGSDMSYADMIRHQLGGDRTDPDNAGGNLDAMGFLTVGRLFLNHLDGVDDRIDVITRGLLGMTVTCARCHDHKFDPIPTKDYYALAGIILSSTKPDDGPSPLMMKDVDKPYDETVMVRGQPGNRGEVAPRQFLSALRRADEPRFNDGSGRVELAERIVAPDNPLTYRVMANRIWTHLIGVSLVETPSDFGFRTKPPLVPAVLDELALDLASHQSVKRVVRRIVLTTTYQRSSVATPDAIEHDPHNDYAMRGNRRRRDFESQRDAMLQVAGLLEEKQGGDPVDISVVGSRPRRTVYAYIDRQNLPGVFRTFDVASPDTHTPNRHYTTIPQQGLFYLNSPIVIQAAVSAAHRVGSESLDDRGWTEAAFVRILGRMPSQQELDYSTKFLNEPLSPTGPAPDPRRTWEYGLATIDSTGFIRRFDRFSTFDKSWQFSSTFPDPTVGYAQISAERGHPGNGGLSGAVVRRWTAPEDGTVTVTGVIGHAAEQGDGVRATFAIGESVLWQEVRKSRDGGFGPLSWPLQNGQSLDLIADDNGTPSYDSFTWRTDLRFVGTSGRIFESSSVNDFSGPLPQEMDSILTRREQLSQLLLISNEFAFVD